MQSNQFGGKKVKTWEMLKTVYSVSDFVQWQRIGSLELSPSFQRRLVWKPGAKSYLLDSIIRGLPIPIIFLRDRKASLGSLKTKREVVDGQQRIRTLIAFVDPKALRDYNQEHDSFFISRTHNRELSGKPFVSLPADVRQRILDYQFSVHVMPAGVDDREVLQIFARMNATGVKLNDQELRNAEYFGEFKTSMYELASEQLNRWRKWGVFTEYNIARMEEVELTSEFALLMLKGISGKTQAAIDAIYGEKDDEFREQREVARRYRHIMDEIDENLGEHLADVPFSRKTLFYSLFAAVYHLLFKGTPLSARSKLGPLVVQTVKAITRKGAAIQKETAPNKVLDAAARRTTHISSRRAIFKYLIKG